MRRRLHAAVRALLGDPALRDTSDAVRLAAIVLAAKTSATTGYATIRARDLSRWLGMSESLIGHTVLPALRTCGVLHTRTTTNVCGQVSGLECTITPLQRARHATPAHPLRLTRAELATLLRLLEALFAPGWNPRNGKPTPPGLLADRRGRGAATDRLALLLIVLDITSNGWLRLCPGRIDAQRGRPAATVARLMGCSAAGGAKILARLTSQGLIEVVRRHSVSGLHNRSRVRVPAIVHAYRSASFDGASLARPTVPSPAVGHQLHGAAHRTPRHRTASAAATAPEEQHRTFGNTDLPATAPGDHTPTTAAARRLGPWQITDDLSEQAAATDLPTADRLHTDHAVVAEEAGDKNGGICLPGEAPFEFRRRPIRAGTREDQVLVGRKAPRLMPAGGEGDPLRRDKLVGSPAGEQSQEQGRRNFVPCVLSVVAGGRGEQRRRSVPRPPCDLEVVLAPVELVWARLERSGARARVIAAVRRELAAVAGVTGAALAGEVLADRLERRLARQGGPAAVAEPVGWLLGRGLIRQDCCSDVRCDEGVRMDNGADCATCGELVAYRRGLRRRVAAQTDADLPGAPIHVRRTATEQRLREAILAEAERARIRHERAAAEHAARRAAIARTRAEAEAAERARLAISCEGCGKPKSAGLCTACGNRSVTEEQIREAALTVAATHASVDDRTDANVVIAQAEAGIQAKVAAACAQARAEGATEDTLALLARLTAETVAGEYRRSALSTLAQSDEAEMEAALAYQTKMRSLHRYVTRSAACNAAKDATEQARQRTAQHLLDARLATLRQDRSGPAAVPLPDLCRAAPKPNMGRRT
ncbi:hypothetical protein [Streptomyces sp. NPDC048644]|uniref:hypothetical protein n=1 Tax=Streptomyces sp. NPDC048644 TaxID=3365582 RepID=UPI00370FA8E8